MTRRLNPARTIIIMATFWTLLMKKIDKNLFLFYII